MPPSGHAGHIEVPPSATGHCRSASLPVPVPVVRERVPYLNHTSAATSPTQHDCIQDGCSTPPIGISIPQVVIATPDNLSPERNSPSFAGAKDSDSNSLNSDPLIRTPSFSSDTSDDRKQPTDNAESYTPDELKYTRLKRISTSSPLPSKHRNIVNKRLIVEDHGMVGRKISMPARPPYSHSHSQSMDADRIRKVLLIFDLIVKQ